MKLVAAIAGIACASLGAATALASAPVSSGSPAAPATDPSDAPSSPPAAHDEVTHACVTSFKQAQLLRRNSRLLDARQQLLTCGRPACPDPIEAKCVEWVQEVGQAMPTIVVSASDPDGQDVIAAELVVDGEIIAHALDGAPIELDPGPHTVMVRVGEMSATRELLAVQGRKNRQIHLELRAPPPKDEPPAEPIMPVVSWVSFGVAGAGVIVGTVTGVVAIVRGREISDQCAIARAAVPQSPEGTCFQFQQSELESAAAIAHSSTVAFAIAGAGIVGGVVGLLVVPRSSRETKSAVEWQPLFGPGGIGVVGRF